MIVLKASNRELVLDKELSANVKNQEGKLEPDNIYLSVKDSDIRDVLSIIAIHMDSSIIFLEEPINLTFEINNNVEPDVALELLIQSNGFSYIKNKDIIIAGKIDSLEQNFFDQMMLTQFDLKYISSNVLKKLIKDLGIITENIIVEENSQSIWVQGAPKLSAR